MNKIIAWFNSIISSVVPPSFPSVKSDEIIMRDNTSWMKVSAVFVIAKKIFIAKYNNISRTWACIDELGGSDYAVSGAETFGIPTDAIDGWRYNSGERCGKVIRFRESDGRMEKTSKEQPRIYFHRGIGDLMPFSYRDEQDKTPMLWNPATGKTVYEFKKLIGIVSGGFKSGSEYIACVMDGKSPGIESTAGWYIKGSVPEIAEVNGKWIAFMKDGTVRQFTKSGFGKTIGVTGSKAQRARKFGRVTLWVTTNWDQLWATDGEKIKLLAEWKSGDKGEIDGSLFGVSMDVESKDSVIIGRTIANKGIEVRRVKLG